MQAKKYLLVGSIFFLSLSTVAYFTILTEGGPFQKKGEFLDVQFDNAEGIKIGNKVTVHGVPYGYVSSVDLVAVDINEKPVSDLKDSIGSKVRVRLIVKQKIPLYENYDIIIKNESLLSGRVIAINPGSPMHLTSDQKVNKDNQLMDLEPTNKLTDTSLLKGKVLVDPLVSLSELIAENRADIRTTVQNISSITSRINEGKGTIGKLINEGDLHTNINTVFTDAQIVLRELREGLEDTREQAPVTSFLRAALSAF